MSDSAFRLSRRVQFAETDVAGVLHFSNYYRLMEEAECAFWRSLGMSVIHREGEQTISWPRVATSCEYFAPAYFEEELEVVLRVSHVGDRSLTFSGDFLRGGERIAAGRATVVCCATKSGTFRPVSIPEAIRAKLTPLVAASESAS